MGNNGRRVSKVKRSGVRFELALVASILLHLAVAPYTKVEESFSLHAVRDILDLGVTPSVIQQYDHIAFPGAVPRTFVGPLALSAATWPFLWIGKQFGVWTTGLAAQILVRAVLGGLTAASLIFLSRRVRDAFNRATANTFLALISTQFHLMFYASRTLPNMFAFPLVQVAVAMLVAPWPRRTQKGEGSKVEVLETFAIFIFVAVVMRLEVAAYMAPLALFALRRKFATLGELLILGPIMALLSVWATITVDSYFWQTPVWPEGAGILFNVVQGHASDWGTSPWHYYFTRSLPRLVPSLPVAIWSMLIDRRSRSIGFPALAFIVLLSFLQHKEWRFFIYALPALNICAAAGIQSLQVFYSKAIKRLALFLFISLNISTCALSLYASVNNYPGGEALSFLSSLRTGESEHRKIHIDSHAAMTGASRFLHPHEAQPWFITPATASAPIPWTYSKNETLIDFGEFDYLVTGDNTRPGFQVIKTFRDFRSYRLRRPNHESWSPLEVALADSVSILSRPLTK